MGYHPWGLKESDTTERLTHTRKRGGGITLEAGRESQRGTPWGHGEWGGPPPAPERHPSFQDRMAGLPQELMLGGGPAWSGGSKESFILRPAVGAGGT